MLVSNLGSRIIQIKILNSKIVCVISKTGKENDIYWSPFGYTK